VTRIELETDTTSQGRVQAAVDAAKNEILNSRGMANGFAALDSSSGLVVPKHLVRKPQTEPVTPTTGLVDYVDSADGQHKSKSALGVVKRQTFDWGSGATFPTSGMRRGDVYYLTPALALCVYSQAGWRLAEIGTVTNYADLKNLPTEVQYVGARCRAEGRLWEYNGTFWDNLSASKPIGMRLFRATSASANYGAAWTVIPYDSADSTFYNPSNEWFEARLTERRVKVLRGGRFRVHAEVVTNRTVSDQYFGIGKVTTASTPDTQRIVSVGAFAGAITVTAEVDLATNDYVGAHIFSANGYDLQDTNAGYHNHLIITRIP
jgi:hypothetical protein